MSSFSFSASACSHIFSLFALISSTLISSTSFFSTTAVWSPCCESEYIFLVTISEITPKTMQRTSVMRTWSSQADTSQNTANMLQKICHGCRLWMSWFMMIEIAAEYCSIMQSWGLVTGHWPALLSLVRASSRVQPRCHARLITSCTKPGRSHRTLVIVTGFLTPF